MPPTTCRRIIETAKTKPGSPKVKEIIIMTRYTAHSLLLTTLEIRRDGTPVGTMELAGSFFKKTRHWVAYGDGKPVTGQTLTDCFHAFVAACEGQPGRVTIPTPAGTRAEIIV